MWERNVGLNTGLSEWKWLWQNELPLKYMLNVSLQIGYMIEARPNWFLDFIMVNKDFQIIFASSNNRRYFFISNFN